MFTAVRLGGTVGNPFRLSNGLLDTMAYLALLFGIALLILLITLAAARFARNRLRQTLQRAGLQVNVVVLLSRALAALVWLLGVILVLDLFGVGLTPLAALVGVLGLAASLSLQSLLQNLVAGVYLLAERPFHINDVIAVVGPNGANHQGRVLDIQMRTTILRSLEDETILIPNSTMFSGVVTNRTAVGAYVRQVTVTLPREMDVTRVRETLLPLLAGRPPVLAHPRPQLRVARVTKDDWSGHLRFWSQEPDAVSETIWAVSQAFPQAVVEAEGGT